MSFFLIAIIAAVMVSSALAVTVTTPAFAQGNANSGSNTAGQSSSQHNHAIPQQNSNQQS